MKKNLNKEKSVTSKFKKEQKIKKFKKKSIIKKQPIDNYSIFIQSGNIEKTVFANSIDKIIQIIQELVINENNYKIHITFENKKSPNEGFTNINEKNPCIIVFYKFMLIS